ncbi:MAG: RNA polymerase subunit sigma-70, partial [Alphaproteobacteria bacterium]|nr:RNA polymerase subunit sigma-70 [Alphaproteobacteria bacterium]
RSGDIAAAEDALADAFRTALETWPTRGVPDNPEAWLLTAARRRQVDAARHAQVAQAGTPTLALAADERAAAAADFPDERLKLLFVCAHPAIDSAMHAPLMLQTVFGLDAARIAPAFLVAPATMSQRLVRAKAKIRDAGIAFSVPEPDALGARLAGVLEAIYAAYGSAWDDVAGADPRRRGLAEETLWLASLTAWLLPQEPEALGLTALLLYCDARRAARRAPDGSFVPLSEQDPARWSREMIAQAEQALTAAANHRRIGPFQLEAAIQSAHVGRILRGTPDWPEIALLYEGLVRAAPTIGALVGRAAAAAEANGCDAGLALLDAIDASTVATYQPFWALRAHLLARAGRSAAARDAFERAIGLAEDQAVRDYLIKKRDAV